MSTNKIKRQLRKESSTFVPNIKASLFNKLGIEEEKHVKKRFNFKPYLLLVPTIIILVISLSFLIIQELSKFSNTFVTIDINPSIELEVDKNEKVVNIRSLNHDAIILLENEKDFVNKDVFTVIDLIIDKASKLGYLDDENKEVTINVINEVQKVENKVKEKMQGRYKNKKNINILANEEFKEKAKENNISVGKMKLIYELLKIDPSMTVEKAKKLSIKELNERIRSYKKDVKDYEDKFQNKLANYLSGKEKVYKYYLRNYNEALKELNEIQKNRKNKQIEKHIELFVNKYLSSYEIKDYNKIFTELKDELNKQKNFVNELIDNHFEIQVNIYKDIIKKEGKDRIANYKFTDFSLISEVSNKYLTEDEKDLIILVDTLNIYLDFISQKSKIEANVTTQAEEMMKSIDEMINSKNIRKEIGNHQLITDLRSKFNNLLTK